MCFRVKQDIEDHEMRRLYPRGIDWKVNVLCRLQMRGGRREADENLMASNGKSFYNKLNYYGMFSQTG